MLRQRPGPGRVEVFLGGTATKRATGCSFSVRMISLPGKRPCTRAFNFPAASSTAIVIDIAISPASSLPVREDERHEFRAGGWVRFQNPADGARRRHRARLANASDRHAAMAGLDDHGDA